MDIRRFVAWGVLICMLSGCAGWSRLDKGLAVASSATTAIDILSSNEIIRNGGYEKSSAWGRHPRPEEVAAGLIGVQLLTLGVAHLVGLFYPEWRTWILGGKTVAGTVIIIHNFNEMKNKM